MHKDGLRYYYASAITNKHGNNTVMQKGGHNNYSANKQNHNAQTHEWGRPAVLISRFECGWYKRFGCQGNYNKISTAASKMKIKLTWLTS